MWELIYDRFVINFDHYAFHPNIDSTIQPNVNKVSEMKLYHLVAVKINGGHLLSRSQSKHITHIFFCLMQLKLSASLNS